MVLLMRPYNACASFRKFETQTWSALPKHWPTTVGEAHTACCGGCSSVAVARSIRRTRGTISLTEQTIRPPMQMSRYRLVDGVVPDARVHVQCCCGWLGRAQQPRGCTGDACLSRTTRQSALAAAIPVSRRAAPPNANRLYNRPVNWLCSSDPPIAVALPDLQRASLLWTVQTDARWRVAKRYQNKIFIEWTLMIVATLEK